MSMASAPLLLAEEGLNGDPEKSIEDDFAFRNNVANATTRIRLAFLRKVYSLLLIQLSATTIVSAIFMYEPKVKLFFYHNDWIMPLILLANIILVIALHVKRMDHPTNLILLSVFTLAQSLAIGVVVTIFEKALVIQAFLITVFIVGGLTLFTFQTNKDFSALGGILFAGLCVLLVGGITQIFFQSNTLELIISFGGAFLFSLFIIYDTQEIMLRLSPEEYVLATINLYLDIINLFLYILRALDAVRRS